MKQQLNKYLRVYLIITVIITNAFINVNFVIAAGTQTNSLDKGLIAHFPLNRAAKQSSTKFADTSPYARIGTITAGASAGLSTNQKGLAGGAYDFDGANTKIVTNWTSNSEFQNGFTISVWIKSDSLGENEQGRIVDKSDSSFAVNGFALVTIVAGGQNSVLFNIKNTGDIYAPITLGAWQHVLVTVNSAAYASMYINGVFKDGKTQAALSGITTANPLIIGNLFSDGRGYDGRISDLRVYNRALSATEVKNLYKSYDPVVQTNSLDKGLIAHFPLNRAAKQSSTKFADTSPYARIGTITAGASAGLSTNQKGLAGGAYDFDGANTKIDTGSDWIGTQAVTISAWIYADGWGEVGNGLGTIIDNGNLILFLYSGGVNELIFYSNGVTYGGSGVNSIKLNTWYHVVVTRNNDNDAHCNFYINGVLSGTANQHSATAGPVAGTTNVIIGNRNAQDRTFDGKISDLRVYNRVLSAGEVKNLYKSYDAGITTKCSGLVDARDGKVYKTIQIGNQCWMAQNLNIGTQVNSPAAASVTAACTGHIGETLSIDGTSCYCETADYASCQLNGVNGTIQKYCYNNTASMCAAEGGLYEWQQTMNLASSCAHSSCTPASGNKGICPSGWHIPTDAEFKILEINQSMSQAQADAADWRGTTQGDKLRGSGLCQGRTPCGTSGFNALLAGYRNVTGAFNGRASYASFWSSLQDEALYTWSRLLYVNYSTVFRDTFSKNFGFSVRCLKD